MAKLEPLVATGVTYYSAQDEAAFFGWLDHLDCVAACRGVGRDLFIELGRAPNDDELRELLALFYRYRVDMRQLARFDVADRTAWFRAPTMFWHRRVFGTSRDGPLAKA